jgi:hypothetical protein
LPRFQNLRSAPSDWKKSNKNNQPASPKTGEAG